MCFTPGKSCFFPPCTRTIWCSCKLCPSPGIHAVTSLPVLNLIRTHFRFAEFGFLGFLMITLRTIPFSCGRPSMAFFCLMSLLFFGGPLCILCKLAMPLFGMEYNPPGLTGLRAVAAGLARDGTLHFVNDVHCLPSAVRLWKDLTPYC